MQCVIIIQARLSSKRLPEKVLKPLGHSTVIKNIVERASRTNFADKVIVATSVESSDDALSTYCSNNNIICYRGSLNNVLERYYECAKTYNADIVVRLTGDNALIDSKIIDKGIDYLMTNKDNDYIKYGLGLPLGLGVEVFWFKTLARAYELASSEQEKEHVTLRMYEDADHFKWTIVGHNEENDYSYLRWTMDTYDDYKLIKRIYEFFDNNTFCYENIISAYELHPEWKEVNNQVKQKPLSDFRL